MSQTRTPAHAEDRGLGLAMLVVFTAAALIATGAVAMLALIDSWWMLGLAFGIHVLMTAAIASVSFIAVSDASPSTARLRRHAARAGETSAPGADVEAVRPHPVAA